MLKHVFFGLLALIIDVVVAAPVLASGGEPGGGGGMNPLDPSALKRDTVLWTAVVFVCLALVLKKFAWGADCRGVGQTRKENR